MLNEINALARMGRTGEVSGFVIHLGKPLRRSITFKDDFVKLSDDLVFVEDYIRLQQIRYDQLFDVDIRVEEEIKDCLIPNLIIQPLVENAIIHGVVDREDGYIKLQAEEQEGDLLLSVYDNGCGIPPDVLARLNSKDQKIPGEHLGLFNVSSIIRLHFGEKYGISAETTPGDGSCVRLLLPIQKKENNNA